MKTLLLSAILLVTLQALAQQQPTCNPFPKTITVTGSAEMNIIPDELYVNIHLREYQKKGEDKKEIEAIKTSFLEQCTAVGIADSLISIVSYTGYSDYYWTKKRKKKSPEMFADIVYQVKFKTTAKMDELVEKLDDEATQNFYVARVSHSKIIEFRKQLKVKAIQSAKDKGIYLTEAINEKLGAAVKIVEPKESGVDEMLTGRANGIVGSNSYSQAKMENYGYDNKSTGIDFKKIKLRFEVEVLFAVQ
jgi:uncharacterized protein